MILGWTVVQPSAHERRLRRAALAATAGCALLLATAAAFGDPRAPMTVAGAAAAALAAFALGVRRRPPQAHEVAVERDGSVRLRPAGAAVPVPAVCAYGAPWLITLRAGAIWVPIWPDSMPREAFRRLSACVLWARATAGSAPNDNDESG